jgi:hypothetical protein
MLFCKSVLIRLHFNGGGNGGIIAFSDKLFSRTYINNGGRFEKNGDYSPQPEHS